MATGNPFMGKVRGKLGDTVLQVLKGQQVSKAYNPHPTNPRTHSQLKQRVKLASAVGFYRRHKRFFKSAFRGKKALESDYNAFIRENINTAPYLSKEDLAHGNVYIAPYLMTRGTLPEVAVEEVEVVGDQEFAILLGSFTIRLQGEFSGHTVKALREGLGLDYGDMLTVYFETFAIGSSLDFPDKQHFNTERHYAKIVFTPKNDSHIINYRDFDFSDDFVDVFIYDKESFGYNCVVFTFVHQAEVFKKCYDVYSGGACAVVTRKVAGSGLQVSTSRIKLHIFAEQLYNLMRSDEALERAMASYKVSDTAFLDPEKEVATEG